MSPAATLAVGDAAPACRLAGSLALASALVASEVLGLLLGAPHAGRASISTSPRHCVALPCPRADACSAGHGVRAGSIPPT